MIGRIENLKRNILLFVLFVTAMLFAAPSIRSTRIVSSVIDSTPIGSTTPSTGAFTTLTTNSLIVNGGVSSAGTGFKHFRVNGGSCTTSGSQGSTCQTGSISLPGTAYPDTNYTVSCFEDGFITVNVGTPGIIGIGTKTASSFTLVVAQIGSVAASYGAVDCITIHD
jgi:hypothetical protein